MKVETLTGQYGLLEGVLIDGVDVAVLPLSERVRVMSAVLDDGNLDPRDAIVISDYIVETARQAMQEVMRDKLKGVLRERIEHRMTWRMAAAKVQVINYLFTMIDHVEFGVNQIPGIPNATFEVCEHSFKLVTPYGEEHHTSIVGVIPTLQRMLLFIRDGNRHIE